MTLRRETAKPQKSKTKKRLKKTDTKQKWAAGQRKEKMSDFLIDVAKYVFTGVIITSLFNDVTNKTILYVVGLGIVVVSLWGGLRLTNKR
jgi:hypothetical protein